MACPAFTVSLEETSVVVTFALPGVADAANITTEVVEGHTLVLEGFGPEAHYAVQHRLPFDVLPDTCQVTFSKKKGLLKFSAKSVSKPQQQPDLDCKVLLQAKMSGWSNDRRDVPATLDQLLHKPPPSRTSAPSAAAGAATSLHKHQHTQLDPPANREAPTATTPDCIDQAPCHKLPTQQTMETLPQPATTIPTQQPPGALVWPCTATTNITTAALTHQPPTHPQLATAAPVQPPTVARPQQAGTQQPCAASCPPPSTTTATQPAATACPPPPPTTTAAQTAATAHPPPPTTTAAQTPATACSQPPTTTATQPNATAHPPQPTTAATQPAATAPPPPPPSTSATQPAATAHTPPTTPAPAPQPTAARPLPSTSTSTQPAAVLQAPSINCTGLAAMLLGSSPGTGSKKAKKLERKKLESCLDRLAQSLESQRWAVCDHFVPDEIVAQIRSEIRQMEPLYTPGEIWVGKEADVGAMINVRDVRGDNILWMDPEALKADAFVKDGKRSKCSFATLERMLRSLDKLVMKELGKRVQYLKDLHQRSDAMLAVYPGDGARFQTHVDNTAGDGRRLTCVVYLNQDWVPSQGGSLHMHPPLGQSGPVMEAQPQGGRVAMFYAADIPHEVLPSFSPRHAVTAWYYDAPEHAEAIMNARLPSGKAHSRSDQSAAKDVISTMLGSGVEPTMEGCKALARKVAALREGAQAIVAAITGAPSVEEFREAIAAMTPDKLMQLRDEIARMGLAGHTPRV